MSLTACGSTGGNLSFGALYRAPAGAGGYKLHVKTQKEQVKQDIAEGNINQKERDVPIDQFKRDSLLP